MDVGKQRGTLAKQGRFMASAYAAAWLLLLLLAATPAARAQRADRGFVVTYLEMRADADGQARTQLLHYAALERRADADAASGAFRVAVLQELDRPERWILLEWAAGQQLLAAREALGTPALQQLRDALAAPPDRRVNYDFGEAGPTPAPGAALTPEAFVAVVHLDIGSPDQAATQAALTPFIAAARASAGNLNTEVWRQAGHPNHYAMLFVWTRRADRDAFASGSATRSFRDRVAALLGSPYDERFYRLRN